MTDTTTKPRRLIQLDVLRGIAILLVLGRHAVLDPYHAGLLKWPAKIWEHLGWTGVDLFFVLSGFLVGGLLLGELQARGTLDIKRFIIRRGFKIWPAYYTLVLGCLIFDALQTTWADSFRLYLPNLLHVQNYFGSGPLGITWTLAVEEHFYLLLPLLLWLLTSGGRRNGTIGTLPYIALAVIALCNGLRLLNLHRPYNDWTHYFPTHLRIDGLAFGVMIAYLHHFHPQTLAKIAAHRRLLFLSGLILISPMAVLNVESRFVWTIGFTMLYLGYGCMLVAFVYAPVNGFFTSPLATAIASIGFFSYSIYLWHITLARHPLMHLLDRPAFAGDGTLHWISWMSIYTLAAYLIGVILGKLIELPSLTVRDRLFPSRSAALPTEGA